RQGESVLLIDRRRRRYMIVLRAGGTSDLRGGKVVHDALLGQDEGGNIISTRGERFLVVRPTLAEFILEMPRGAQVIYPKDLGAILLAADIFPGARVLEAGTGSGALTMALRRAVGPQGRVTSYDLREEFARIAERNIQRFLGALDSLVLRRQDIYAGVLAEDLPIDRIILDLPEPWRVVGHAAHALAPGGIFVSYVPTVPQVVHTTEALRNAGAFAMIETIEVLMRPWNIEGLSVRPAHRMVAHTGFLTAARRVQSLAAQSTDVPEPEGPADGEEDDRG
ncbi:MAG TPA: tRNA (adenine-N1)-methyltransferase, partial [bacterium]|nr:tRNA (adenine-N1)-methyltransferase [bacterium]